ncbi:MAG: hypothetical protein HMLKMBBP_02119 [Planctomycetes bacterium]|nr:hypothetical protein [Planctomycetota bacterium]
MARDGTVRSTSASVRNPEAEEPGDRDWDALGGDLVDDEDSLEGGAPKDGALDDGAHAAGLADREAFAAVRRLPRAGPHLTAPTGAVADVSPRAPWTDDAARECVRLLEALVLDTGERWGDRSLMPWQREAFAATLGLPGHAAGAKSQLWVEGPTGCGKDQVIAAVCLAALRFAPAGYEVVNYSADLDRCRDLVKTVRGFIQRTDERAEAMGIPRWLGEGITILRDEIRREAADERGRLVVRAVARIESLDGYSASGARADLFIANEVQSWPEPHGERVWDEALARYDKLPHGRFAVFSNAPFSPAGDFRRDERERAAACAADSPWHFVPVSVEDCPWIGPEKLERKRASLAPHVFRRLYLCLPTDGRGELVSPAVYDRAVDPGYRPPSAPAPGDRCYHGLDVGVSRDHAVHAIVRRCAADGRLYLDRIRVWLPPPRGQIDLDGIEAEVAASLVERPGRLLADPYQAVQMCQALARGGNDVRQIPFTTESLTRMCEAVRSAFNDRRLVLFADAGLVSAGGGAAGSATTSLRRQVLEAEVAESERGSRIRSRRGRGGHGDQLAALALALLGAAEDGVQSCPAVGAPPEREPEAGHPADSHPGRRGYFRPHGGRLIGARVERRRIIRGR